MPTYETAEDKEKERIIAEIFCKHMGVEHSEAPVRSRYDFCIVKRFEWSKRYFARVLGIAEVKVRTCSIDAHPTFMIDADKKVYMCERASEYVTPYLVVCWTDAIGWIDFRAKSFISLGGRYDRNDPADHKLVVHYAIDSFNLLVDKR